jgi:Leucine-rich repeat (LRR) protein
LTERFCGFVFLQTTLRNIESISLHDNLLNGLSTLHRSYASSLFFSLLVYSMRRAVLSDGIGMLPKLKALDVRNNRLTALPRNTRLNRLLVDCDWIV